MFLSGYNPTPRTVPDTRQELNSHSGRKGEREGGQEKGPAEKGLLPTPAPSPAPVQRTAGFAIMRQKPHEGISILTTGDPQKRGEKAPKCA